MELSLNALQMVLMSALTLIIVSESYVIIPPSSSSILSDRNLLLKLKRSLFSDKARVRIMTIKNLYQTYSGMQSLSQPKLGSEIMRHFTRNRKTYNECPEAEPFPCKTKVMECISLKHVCDGNRDCADGWDEDEGVCIAYQRVPAEDLIKFVQQQAYWLVPSFFTSIVTKPEDLNAIASALSTSANLDNFSRTLGLNRPDAKKFQSALYAVRGNDMRTLESFGMDPDSWTEVKIVFKNLIDSGLL